MSRPNYFSGIHSRKEFRHAIKRADRSIFDEAMQFLEDDPYTFGSGYMKELIWHFIRRYDLSETDVVRLEQVALRYLQRPISREFAYMCRTMCYIATPTFWDAVRAQLESDNSPARYRALCLLPYAKGIHVGERQRLAMWERKRGYRWNVWRKSWNQGITVDDLIKTLYNPNNWKDGKVPIKPVDEADFPIDPYLSWRIEWDRAIAGIDYQHLNTSFKWGLINSLLEGGNEETWLYACYIIKKTNREDYVPVLIRFLRLRVDYKVYGCSKAIVLRAIFSVFEHFGTPRALQAIKERSCDQRPIMGTK